MKTNLFIRFVSSVLGLCLAFVLTSDAKDTKPDPTFGEEIIIELSGKVEAINAETREITLRGKTGNAVTITADSRIKRFNEIRIGDEIEAAYYVSLAAEIRPATEDEKQQPFLVLENKARAPEGTAPAGGGLRIVRVVGTVEGLDRPASMVTLKGPRNNVVTTHVKDAAVLESIQLGDAVIVTYTEALAIKLEKPALPAVKP